ncbi:hypothetical protein HX891_22055 [Pseudomonas reactans]|uniref:hypothetical protein n=1 Tax=Pseudomonas reactans TaxID=117680 RepID=UPI0015BDAE47|nr:hypothetical protein [Pseudomonas reactans]NWD83073.1 hypothetical protein [Pseudomonas reactans]
MKNSTHYALSQEQKPGCPIGMLDAALYDKFYEHPEKIKYGFFPWYSENNFRHPKHKLPEGITLIGKGSDYRFGARNLFKSIYAIDEKFLKTCQEAKVNFHDIQPMATVDKYGTSISKSAYYAVVFKCSEEIAGISGEGIIKNELGHIEHFESIIFSKDITENLFRFNKIAPPTSTLFCTENFMKLALINEVEGIKFLPAASSSSSKIYPI